MIIVRGNHVPATIWISKIIRAAQIKFLTIKSFFDFFIGKVNRKIMTVAMPFKTIKLIKGFSVKRVKRFPKRLLLIM